MTEMNEQQQRLGGPVASHMGRRVIYIGVAAVIFVFLCSTPLWLAGWWWNGTEQQATSPSIVAPIYAAPLTEQQLGYATEQDALGNCSTGDVEPIWRSHKIVGYSCVLARY